MIDDTLMHRLRGEVSVPAGDDDRLASNLAVARIYVASAIGDHPVAAEVLDDCIVACAADLYNMRDARLGVMDTGDAAGVQPYRVSADPLRSVWPKLKAAGVNTGGMVIA